MNQHDLLIWDQHEKLSECARYDNTTVNVLDIKTYKGRLKRVKQDDNTTSLIPTSSSLFRWLKFVKINYHLTFIHDKGKSPLVLGAAVRFVYILLFPNPTSM